MIENLPIHPLAVHLPVVLIPLATLSVIVLLLLKHRSKQLSLAVAGIVVVAAIASVVSYFSGEALADLKGYEPETHEQWGKYLMYAACVFAVIATPWLWKLSREGDELKPSTRPLGVVTVLAGLVASVLTFLAGHSGAEAAWSDVAAGKQSASPSNSETSPSASAASSGAASEAAGYTVDEVAKHNTAEDCWVIIDGSVYDLTQWVNNHPGGPNPISGMCGTDGTERFQGKHGGADEPTEELAKFLLGPVG